jgi:hypothetical protein
MSSEADRFKHRRRMAWLCLLAGVVGFPVMALFVDVEMIRALAGPFYTFATIAVTAYVAAASYEHTHPRSG